MFPCIKMRVLGTNFGGIYTDNLLQTDPPIPSMAADLVQHPDIPYFQFNCHLISKKSPSTPLVFGFPSVKVDFA